MCPVIALITCTFCVLMVLDYSKWDAFVDSDEEQTAPPSANTGRPVAAKSAPTMPPKNDAQPEKPVVLDARAAVDKFGSLDVSSISCTLHIEMDRAPRQVPGLLNRFEEPGAKLLSCKMNHPAVFTGDDLVDLTPDQLASVACDESEPLPATVYLSSSWSRERTLSSWQRTGCGSPCRSSWTPSASWNRRCAARPAGLAASTRTMFSMRASWGAQTTATVSGGAAEPQLL